MRSLGREERTLGQLLQLRYDGDTIRLKGVELEKRLTNLICARLAGAKLEQVVADSVAGGWVDSIFQNRYLSRMVDAAAQATLKKTIAEKVNEIIAGKVNEMIAERAPDAVFNLLDSFRMELLDMRVCDLYAKYRDREEALVARVTDMYRSILGKNLGKLLKAVNIERIVEDKINAFDAAELENMIFDIMRRELRAIVWLGALLGSLMGFVNLLL